MMILKTAIGGLSVLDHPRLRLKNRDEAVQFLKAFGYDVNEASDQARLWNYHSRAVTYIQTQLLTPKEKIPPILTDGNLIQDFTQLLLWASDVSSENPERKERQHWSCALLRVIHVLIHLTNDLFTAFSDEIQEQMLRPYRDVIASEGDRVYLKGSSDEDRIWLKRFDVKPFKTSNSSITKLLAKPEEVAFGVLDKLGVRFLTHSVFDGFRVLHGLFRHNVISYPHLIPDQSNNTLYPLNVFMEVMEEFNHQSHVAPDDVDQRLHEKLKEAHGRAAYREKINVFTSREYRFMKFIVRRLIRAGSDTLDRPFMFFYPHEIQIVDWETYQKNSVGPSSHPEYKARQRARARERVFHWEKQI